MWKPHVNIWYDYLMWICDTTCWSVFIRAGFDHVSKGVWLYVRSTLDVTAAELLFSFQKGGNWMFAFVLIAASLFSELYVIRLPPLAFPLKRVVSARAALCLIRYGNTPEQTRSIAHLLLHITINAQCDPKLQSLCPELSTVNACLLKSDKANQDHLHASGSSLILVCWCS